MKHNFNDKVQKQYFVISIVIHTENFLQLGFTFFAK